MNNETSCGVTSIFQDDLHYKYQELSSQFSQFHKSPLNVGLHFVTTPLGVLGMLCMLRSVSNSTSIVATLMLLYIISLSSSLTVGSFVGTVALCGILLSTMRLVRLNFFFCLICIGLAYGLQDLAHIITGEETFQNSYTKGPGQVDVTFEWLNKFMEHSYFLLPLCVDVALPFFNLSDSLRNALSAPLPASIQLLASYKWLVVPLVVLVYGSYCLDSRNRFSFFPGLPTFQRVIAGDLYESEDKDSHKEDIQMIRKWVMNECPSDVQSTHYWYWALPQNIKDGFRRCATAPTIFKLFHNLFTERHYCVDVVEGMNEIYVTGPERFDEGPNSDQIFDMRHVDGPWGIIPFVSVYRCLIGMDRNYVVKTMCPFPNLTQNLTEGKVMGFDFNREVHYIARDYSKQDISDKYRVTLKCHYCVYPRILAPLGWFMHWLNVRYNKLFRTLFLSTIQPVTPYEKMMAYNVTFNTLLMDKMETYIGEKNILYLAVVGLISYLCNSYTLFLVSTSFIHYMRYISTYAVQKSGEVDFGSWKRDALLFKTLSLGQLIFMYAYPASQPFEVDYISVAMIASGYFVSMLATNTLGVDRTYFGAELGVVKPMWVNTFPYGYIPHPMILSQVWALLGFYHAAHMRANAYPWLIPAHITFYLIHMLQEHFGVFFPESYYRNSNTVEVK